MKRNVHPSLRKCVILLMIAVGAHLSSYSQFSAGNYFEAGLTAGPMVFLGDLGGHFGRGTSFIKDYNMKATKLSVGAFIAAHPSELIGFRFAITYGQLDGDDAYITGKGGLEEARLNRNRRRFAAPIAPTTSLSPARVPAATAKTMHMMTTT